MNTTRKLVLLAASALTAGITLTACGGSADESAAPAASATATAETTTSRAADPGTQATHNQADAMFSQHMIPHHQQAIEMSDMLLAKENIDERVVTLAEQIKAEQAPEINEMRGWLNQWGVPEMPMSGTGMPGHGGHGMGPDGSMMPGMPMAGMMSPADMAELQNAQGVDASRLFLEQMIRHHEGAITMARNEIDNGQYPDAVDLARAISVDQQREIDLMKQILGSL